MRYKASAASEELYHATEGGPVSPIAEVIRSTSWCPQRRAVRLSGLSRPSRRAAGGETGGRCPGHEVAGG